MPIVAPTNSAFNYGLPPQLIGGVVNLLNALLPASDISSAQATALIALANNQYTKTVDASINGTPGQSILIDAGAGNTLGNLYLNANPGTDVLGAARNITPTAETKSIPINTSVPYYAGGATLTALHAIALSSEASIASMVGKAYVRGGTTTTQTLVEDNDARFEWLLASNVKGFWLQYEGVGAGPTYQQANLRIIGMGV